jgi:hypothetical protein
MTFQVGEPVEWYSTVRGVWSPALIVLLSQLTEEAGIAITESACLVHASRIMNYWIPLERLRRREL